MVHDERCYANCYQFYYFMYCELMKVSKGMAVTSQYNIKLALGRTILLLNTSFTPSRKPMVAVFTTTQSGCCVSDWLATPAKQQTSNVRNNSSKNHELSSLKCVDSFLLQVCFPYSKLLLPQWQIAFMTLLGIPTFFIFFFFSCISSIRGQNKQERKSS